MKSFLSSVAELTHVSHQRVVERQRLDLSSPKSECSSSRIDLRRDPEQDADPADDRDCAESTRFSGEMRQRKAR